LDGDIQKKCVARGNESEPDECKGAVNYAYFKLVDEGDTNGYKKCVFSCPEDKSFYDKTSGECLESCPAFIWEDGFKLCKTKCDTEHPYKRANDECEKSCTGEAAYAKEIIQGLYECVSECKFDPRAAKNISGFTQQYCNDSLECKYYEKVGMATKCVIGCTSSYVSGKPYFTNGSGCGAVCETARYMLVD